jgi:hypothetical protein
MNVKSILLFQVLLVASMSISDSDSTNSINDKEILNCNLNEDDYEPSFGEEIIDSILYSLDYIFYFW